MKKLIEHMCLSLWKVFGKREHVPCRWCIPKVAPLCTEECKLACPMTKEYDKSTKYSKKGITNNEGTEV